MEKTIKNIIKDVLELEDDVISTINNESELVEVGLDSLKAIELIVHIEDKFDIMVDEEDLLIDNIVNINKIKMLIDKYKE